MFVSISDTKVDSEVKARKQLERACKPTSTPTSSIDNGTDPKSKSTCEYSILETEALFMKSIFSRENVSSAYHIKHFHMALDRLPRMKMYCSFAYDAWTDTTSPLNWLEFHVLSNEYDYNCVLICVNAENLGYSLIRDLVVTAFAAFAEAILTVLNHMVRGFSSVFYPKYYRSTYMHTFVPSAPCTLRIHVFRNS